MTQASLQGAISYRLLLRIPIAAAAGLVPLIRAMRELGLRAQFMVLLILGVSVGFIFLMMAWMPEFPQWLGGTPLDMVFMASIFGVRIFLRSVAPEEKDEDDKIRETLATRAIRSFQT